MCHLNRFSKITIIIIEHWQRTRNERKNIRLTFSEEDANSGVAHDALLHLESLLVVASGQSEDVSGESLAQNFAIELLAHLSFIEGATKSSR